MRFALALTLACVSTGYSAGLPDRIAAMVDSAPVAVKGAIGVHVVNLATGKPVYEHNEHQLFLPASNLKLFTAALALTRLGPDYRYTTRVVREPSGSLVWIGSGDPSMSSRVYPYGTLSAPLGSLHAVEDLADQIVAAGIRRVDGDVVGDDQHYPWSPYPESWTADDGTREFGAPVSALSLNDNTVQVVVRAGQRPGDLGRIDIDPGFEYFTIDNRVTTTGAQALEAVRITRVPGTRQLVFTGVMNTRGPELRLSIPVDDPALFAAHALYDALVRRGVTVRGRPVARHRVAQTANPSDGEVLASRESPPLAQLLQMAMKLSHNLHAELFLREVGAVRQGQGSVTAGLREMRVMLTEFRIPQADFVSEDGSGLARNDEIAPRAITQLLSLMNRGDQHEIWRSLFPVGGQDGTLSSRLCCTVEPVSIRAKTGTLSRAIALSGYADSPGNGRLAFSIMVNNFAAPSSEVRDWVDRLATALVE